MICSSPSHIELLWPFLKEMVSAEILLHYVYIFKKSLSLLIHPRKSIINWNYMTKTLN